MLPVVYACMIYFAVGLRAEPSAFFAYLALSLCSVLVAQGLGLCLSCLFPNVALANCVAFVLILLVLMFSGFYIPVNELPLWCRWGRYASFLFWGFRGMVVNEYAGRELPCDAQRPGEYSATCPFSGDLVLAAQGLDGGSVGGSLAVLVGFAAVFRVAGYVCLRFDVAIS